MVKIKSGIELKYIYFVALTTTILLVFNFNSFYLERAVRKKKLFAPFPWMSFKK